MIRAQKGVSRDMGECTHRTALGRCDDSSMQPTESINPDALHHSTVRVQSNTCKGGNCGISSYSSAPSLSRFFDLPKAITHRPTGFTSLTRASLRKHHTQPSPQYSLTQPHPVKIQPLISFINRSWFGDRARQAGRTVRVLCFVVSHIGFYYLLRQ